MAAMVRTCPHILVLSLEKNMKPKLAWLQEKVDLNDEQVVVVVKVRSRLLFSAEVGSAF